MSLDSDARPPADGSDSEWLARIRAADTLGELADSLGFESADEAYFEAKRRWARRSVASLGITAGLPGERVRVDDTDFVVHGITHANTLPEQELLRHHVSTVLAGGASVYCE